MTDVIMVLLLCANFTFSLILWWHTSVTAEPHHHWWPTRQNEHEPPL